MASQGPIKRQKTLTEQAAEAIRGRIIGGQFAFGEALSEITLANELGVSKTPVREAFLQLKNEGLVEILPQKGTFVFQMTPEELRQLSELREILELNSLRLALRDREETLTPHLQTIVSNMKRAAEERDAITYRRLDADFHNAIIRSSRNAFIQSAYNIIAVRVQAFRNRLSLDAHNWRSLDEHRKVAELIEAGKADDAAEALGRHIRGAYEDYVARIAATPASTA